MFESLWRRSEGRTKFFQYFDHIYCLSLNASHERKARARSEFARLGVELTEFFEATGKDDPVVEQYLAEGKVRRYPPCFRCGRLACGREDCNNLLIPAQIATFISHMRIWQSVLDKGYQRVLIVEDDIAFTDYAEKVVSHLGHHPDKLAPLSSDSPCLIRLGWGKCAEHKPRWRINVVPGAVRMANHGFAINRAMAERLLAEFKTVDTTVDIYIHDVVGSRVENYSVLPPIIHDLSWGVGEFDSLIHPKAVRVEYLKNADQGADEDIQRAEQLAQAHILKKHVYYQALAFILNPANIGLESLREQVSALPEAQWDRDVRTWFRITEEQAADVVGKKIYVIDGKQVYFGKISLYLADPARIITAMAENLDTLREQAIVGHWETDTGNRMALAARLFSAWVQSILRLQADEIVRHESELPVASEIVEFDGAILEQIPESLRTDIVAYCEKYGYRPRIRDR